MATYFDEHNCQELGDGQAPDHLMHYARLLIDTGVWNQARKYFKLILILQTSISNIFETTDDILTWLLSFIQEEFGELFGNEGAPPPASKKFIDGLDDIQLVNDEGKSNVLWFCKK